MKRRLLLTGMLAGIMLGTMTLQLQATNLSHDSLIEETVIQDELTEEENATGYELRGISMRSTLPLSALEEGYLEVTFDPVDATNRNLLWYSSNPEIVTIDQEGNFKTLKKGKSVITAVSEENPDITATCEIEVINNVKFCSDIKDLQSTHPYESNYSDGWMYTMPGEKGLFVTFDTQCSFYEDSDMICVMDKDRYAHAIFTGKQAAGKKVEIPGDTVVIMMYTDSKRTDWGFKVTEVRNNTPIYNVKFNANGATSGSMSTLTGIHGGEAFNLPALAFKKDGYIFHSWNTKADGTGVDYADQATVTDLTTRDGKTVTLYAQWDKKLEIIKQPEDLLVEEDSSISFQVEAVGVGLTYQWQYSNDEGTTWNNMSGDSAKTDCVVLDAKAEYRGYLVRCVVRDRNKKKVTSRSARLGILLNGPIVITQPKALSIVEGEKGSFHVEAEGDYVRYQWMISKDHGESWTNSTATSAKTATYSFTAKRSQDGYLVKCALTNAFGKTRETDAVLLTVYEKLQILTQPQAVTAVEGTYATFKIVATGTDLTYQWQYSQDNGTTWKNSGAASSVTAKYVLEAKESRNGYLIRCIVKDAAGKTAISNAVKLTVKPAGPEITTQPKAVTAVEGTNATFKVAAIGTDLTYQWQYSQDKGTTWKNSGAASGVTPNYVLGAKASRNGYLIRCIVKDAAGKTAISNAVKLTVKPAGPEITTQPKAVIAAEGTNATFKVVATGTGLTYQWQYSQDKGTTWKNSGAASGVTATYVLGAKASRNGYLIRCIVKDANGNSVTSSAVKLTVTASVAK